MLRIIAYCYLVVLFFIGIFLLSLTKAVAVSPTFSNPRWSLMVAAVLVLPLLLPALKYVTRYIKTIKFSDVEVSFAQVEVASYSLATLARQLSPPSDQMSAPEYAGIMTSQSDVIVDAIKEVQRAKDEILVVDLGQGEAWIPPNLYFLALLASQRTSARQILFVETRRLEGTFVGMCSPDELKDALSRTFPMLHQAALKSNYEQQPLDATIGQQYFGALKNLYGETGISAQVRELWLTAPKLRSILGSSLDREKIDVKAALTERDYRKILLSAKPYAAVVNDDQVESVLSRDRVALFVARCLAAK